MALYGGTKEESLNTLWLHKYHDKVATSLTQVQPQNLPPTCGAAKYHSERVFLQICQWKDPDCEMQPELWGWHITETGYHPIATDLPPAPEELLKIIRCNCTTDCSSARFSC